MGLPRLHEPEEIDTAELSRVLRLVSAAAYSGLQDEINAQRRYLVQRDNGIIPVAGGPTVLTLPPLAAQLVKVTGVVVSFNPSASLTEFRLQIGGGAGNPLVIDLALAGGNFVITPLVKMVQAADLIQVTVNGVPAANGQTLSLVAWGEQEPVTGTAN